MRVIALVLFTALLAVSAGCSGVLPSENPTPEPGQDTELACLEPPRGNWQLGDVDIPEVSGQTPGDAADILDAAAIAVSWRYSYASDPEDENALYSECWCVPPPDGLVQDVAVAEGGWLIVMVERGEAMPGGRPQPRLGWGC